MSAATDPKLPAPDRVYRALDATKPATAAEIARRVGVHVDTARRALRKLNDGEAVTRSRAGRSYMWLGVQRWMFNEEGGGKSPCQQTRA